MRFHEGQEGLQGTSPRATGTTSFITLATCSVHFDGATAKPPLESGYRHTHSIMLPQHNKLFRTVALAKNWLCHLPPPACHAAMTSSSKSQKKPVSPFSNSNCGEKTAESQMTLTQKVRHLGLFCRYMFGEMLTGFTGTHVGPRC